MGGCRACVAGWVPAGCDAGQGLLYSGEWPKSAPEVDRGLSAMALLVFPILGRLRLAHFSPFAASEVRLSHTAGQGRLSTWVPHIESQAWFSAAGGTGVCRDLTGGNFGGTL